MGEAAAAAAAARSHLRLWLCVRQTALLLENQTVVFAAAGIYLTGLILSTKPQQRQTLLGQPL